MNKLIINISNSPPPPSLIFPFFPAVSDLLLLNIDNSFNVDADAKAHLEAAAAKSEDPDAVVHVNNPPHYLLPQLLLLYLLNPMLYNHSYTSQSRPFTPTLMKQSRATQSMRSKKSEFKIFESLSLISSSMLLLKSTIVSWKKSSMSTVKVENYLLVNSNIHHLI